MIAMTEPQQWGDELKKQRRREYSRSTLFLAICRVPSEFRYFSNEKDCSGGSLADQVYERAIECHGNWLADIAGRCSENDVLGGGQSSYTILISCDIHSM